MCPSPAKPPPLFRGESDLSFNAWFVGPHQSTLQNRTSIHLVVFAGLTHAMRPNNNTDQTVLWLLPVYHSRNVS